MAQGKQAKILSDKVMRSVLSYLENTRNPIRDQLIFLLSAKAGLRAVEISRITWGMLTDAEGDIGEVIALENKASKGKYSGRTIPLNRALKTALKAYKAEKETTPDADDYLIDSEKGDRMKPGSIHKWFYLLYKELGIQGCSSHSGRRTFATKAAREIIGAGGTLKDVQDLMGHSSLQTTQRYIQGNTDAKRRVVDLI
jgi:integrase/recombinase XerD